MKRQICLSALLVMILSITTSAGEYYFYRPENRFGSDLAFNPLSLMINGSYDILRNGAHDKNILNQAYGDGWDNVWAMISDPIGNIDDYGWKNFIEQECFNVTLNSSKGQFVPNVSTHLIGNGMLYVMMAEWYDYHNVKHPYISSALTTTLYQVLNEVIENGKWRHLNVDPIADLLIFNPLGIILFSTDFGKRFFSETFPIYYWSQQPIINTTYGHLENAGQQYAMKYPLPFWERGSFFLYWGINGLVGLTYSRDGINNYSFGVGTVANKLNEKRLNGGRFLTPTMDGAVAVFYDRNHSLMGSLMLTGPRLYNARINIYPGVVSDSAFMPGMYLGFGEWDGLVFGLTLSHLPIGLATGRK